MKKKMMKRMWIGLPVGIAMGYIITLIISACIGDGAFYPVAPEFAEKMGNELNAVILQTVLCGVIGVGFAAASVIWELDSWSLAKQSGVYFFVIGLVLLPIAYVTRLCSSRKQAIKTWARSTQGGKSGSYGIVSLYSTDILPSGDVFAMEFYRILKAS